MCDTYNCDYQAQHISFHNRFSVKYINKEITAMSYAFSCRHMACVPLNGLMNVQVNMEIFFAVKLPYLPCGPP